MDVILLAKDLCKVLSSKEIMDEIEEIGIDNRMTLVTTMIKYDLTPSREFLDILTISLKGLNKESELLSTHPNDKDKIALLRNVELILDKCSKGCNDSRVKGYVEDILIKYRSNI